MNYGRMFRIARERSGLSQKDAAEKIGVKAYQLANYETNRSEPSLTVLVKMSRVYNITLDRMLYNTKLQQRSDGPADDYRAENERLFKELKQLISNYQFLEKKEDEEK